MYRHNVAKMNNPIDDIKVQVRWEFAHYLRHLIK